MYRRDEPLRERTSLRYAVIEAGGHSWTFRRLTPSEAALQLQEVQDVLDQSGEVFKAHAAMAEANAKDPDAPEAKKAWSDASKEYGAALANREAALGYTIALMWADSHYALESFEDLRAAIKVADDPIMEIGPGVYAEVYDEIGDSRLMERLFLRIMHHQTPPPLVDEDPGPSAAKREAHFGEAQAETT